MNEQKILYFGTLPPPVGGVSIFNKKFTEYLKRNKNIVFFFGVKNIFRSYDIAFINYSIEWKRFVATLISFFLCKKVIVIVHSSQFKLGLFNFLTILICTKVLTTSSKVINNSIMKYKFIKVESLLFREFFNSEVLKNRINNFNKKNEKRCYNVLFYQFNNKKVEGQYIYGADKMFKLLKEIEMNFNSLPIKVIWIDLSGEMESRLVPYSHFVKYIKYPVDLNVYWEKIDLLIRPTLFDGTAFMLVEAMLNNVKVLCSDLPSRPNGVYKIPHGCNYISYDFLENILESDESIDYNQDLFKLLPSISNFLDKI